MTDTFPIIVDNFFKDPDKIRRIGLKLIAEQHDCILNDDNPNSNYPGVRTHLPQQILDEVILQIRDLCKKDVNFVGYHPSFHITSSIHELGLIHADNHPMAGLIYLNENPKEDSGTILCTAIDENDQNDEVDGFFESVKTREVSEIQKFIKIKKERNKRFHVDDVVENKYNRLVMYPGNRWHAPHKYFGNNLYNSRLVIVFWLDGI